MKTLYVPLDEVILLLHTNFPLLEQERTLRNALKDIEYLPTIDPIAIIDKMIDKIDCYIHASKRDNISEWTLGYEMQKAVLGELKSRLLLK